MNDLCDITIQRLKIELGRLKEKVQENSKAMHNMHAAKGILRSGATIAAEIEIGRNAFKSFRDICIQNLQVMSDEAVFLTGVSISRITTSISEMYTELHGSIFENMTKSCEHSSKPELRERYMPEIENEMNNTLSEIKLFIDERIISKGNQGAITMLKLFVSHCSKDVEIVEPLVDLIRSALNLNAGDIRCTSIDGYRLPGGADTDDQLRGEVHDSEAFIGVISSNSIDSMYVVFELGARWGVKKHLLPLLAPGTSAAVLAGPLKGLNALRLDSAAQIHQFVNDLGKVLQITPELAATYQKHVDAILRVRQGPVLMTGEIKEERPETADEEETMGDGPGAEAFKGLIDKLWEGGHNFGRQLLSQVAEIKNSDIPDEKKTKKLKLLFEVELDEVTSSMAKDEEKPEREGGAAGIGFALINRAIRQKKQALAASVKILSDADPADNINEVFDDVEDAIRTFTELEGETDDGG